MDPLMKSDEPETVICTYRVKRGKEGEFLDLLEQHWPTLRKAGLATDEPPRIYRGSDESGNPFFMEIFTWVNGKGAASAHETPEVMAIWEPMGAITEARDGRPAMEFPNVKPIAMSFAPA